MTCSYGIDVYKIKKYLSLFFCKCFFESLTCIITLFIFNYVKIYSVFTLFLAFCSLCFAEVETGDSVFVSPAKLDSIVAGRNLVYQSLKKGDSNGALDAAASLRAMSPVPEFALDDLELMEIYLMTDRFDSAIVMWGRIYSSVLEEVRYSYVSDSLLALLNETYSYLIDKTIKTDSLKVKSLFDRALKNIVSQENRDLALIIKDVELEYSLNSKFSATHSYGCNRDDDCGKVDAYTNLKSGMYVRVVGGYLECNLDTTRLDSVILQLKKFKSDYPESEFIPWIQNLLEWRISQRKSVAHRSNYYKERLYTGGIGIEVWGSVRSILVGVPIQFGRVVFDFLFGGIYHYGGTFIATAGVDVFETDRFKIVPFVGGIDPLVAGVQLEYRPWIFPCDAHGLGEYVSFKFRYMAMYGKVESKNEGKKKEFHNGFFIGAGFHLW